MFDVVIRNGQVVDGTGAPARRADVAIRGDRVAEIGAVTERAHAEIDAAGRVVCPGFVDVHTHYDAQVFWDGTCSPSPYHGVTTIVGGNCGFSIAPLAPDAGDYLMRMLARVEGMPLESLRAGVPWDWRSFGEYLDRLEGRLAVNAGFMVGHSALRRVVMGERAVGHAASEDEQSAMVALLRRSLREGGLGFSSTVSPTHNDGEGQPVPSRHASREELLALAAAVREQPGTTLEFLPGVGVFTDAQKQLMADLSLAANRPLNWNVLVPSAGNEEMVAAQLSATDYARARGAEVVALTVPQAMTVRINLHTGFVFDALPGWAELFRLPIEARKRRLADPVARKTLDESANSERAGLLRGLARWENMRIVEAFTPETKRWEGRTVGELARETNQGAFDAMVELAIADDLRTSFMPMGAGDRPEDWTARGRVWHDDRTVIGASDAGAHLDMIDTFAVPTQVLGNGVRRHGVISLEEGVRQLCEVPARLYGLRERGRLAVGWRADVVVFDPQTIGCGPTYTRFDLPAGAGRLYADATGIDHVLVNGVEIVRGGTHTGALPGTVLRAGRDTDTVAVPGGQRA
ncbi:MAG TPA: amidohydrolase family protein [Myxococcota bacterium]|nr:amidohydrolase family protein [Myxococcota bacterium]